MLGGVFSVSVERLLHVICFEPLEEGEQARNYTDSAHYVVHVGCVNDYICPMIAVFLVWS